MTARDTSALPSSGAEREVFGITYDRAATIELQKKLVERFALKTVLESPSHGAKAAGSLYSLGFALSGCQVTLVNPETQPLRYWNELGLADQLTTTEAPEVTRLPFADNQFDLVWNFVTFTALSDPDAWLQEMIRVSRNYVFVINCNNFQLGYPWHRILHRVFHLPWTHGEVAFNYPWRVKQWFAKYHLSPVELGTIDSPPWPDPVGFRDVRLHRAYGRHAADQSAKAVSHWDVPMIDYLRADRLPLWIELLKAYDLPLRHGYKKLPMSHLFYVVAQKQ
jgi:hypothetical protein